MKNQTPIWSTTHERVVRKAVVEATSDLRRKIRRLQDELRDAKSVVKAADYWHLKNSRKLRYDRACMDWLEKQHVEVRIPLVYGSMPLFVAQDLSEDGEATKTDLRSQCLTALGAKHGLLSLNKPTP